MGDMIVKNGFIITMDGERTMIPKGVIEIKDGLITHIGTKPSRTMRESITTVIDATGKSVMPGLINGHTHLCMTFGRTIGFEVNVMDWLNKILFPIMDGMDETDYYVMTLVGILENLKNGNTTAVNNVCSSHNKGVNADRATAKAIQETGHREFLALCFTDQNHYPQAVEDKQGIVARCRDAVQTYHNTENGRLKMLVGPELPWGSSSDMFRETLRLAEAFDIGLHMHTNENENWFERGKEAHGLSSNVGIFKKFGCLGPNTSLACMRFIKDEDIQDLVETGTGVIFDPTTAFNWGTGLPPIPKVLRAGVRVGLGTNGAASNFGQDMFETMKNAVAASRTVDGATDALPLATALEMGTIRNAEILGIEDQVGSLEVGKKADIITVNLNKCHLSPCLNVLAATVLSASGADVEEVIVDGEMIIQGGKPVRLDEAALVQEAGDRALRCAKKAGLDDRLCPLWSAG
jgi:5-methylthioadenosine/S-adenosylhomocysteine deaminase